jgi:hypothetical protein
MSFEGYTRRLCKAGHLHEIDVYDDDVIDSSFGGSTISLEVSHLWRASSVASVGGSNQ